MVVTPGTKLAPTEEIERTLGLGAHSRKWRSRLVRVVVLAALAAAALVGARSVLRARHPTMGPRFETSPVTRADLRATVTATGTLKAVGSVDVGSEVSGRIQRVLVTYNDPVKKGQLLAETDPVQLRAEATQAESQVAAGAAGIAQAEATVLEAKQTLDRTEAQVKETLASTKDLEAARATYARAVATAASAKATAAIAEATRKSASWKLAKTKVVSPIDGVVMTRSIEPGQTVQAAFTTPVLFTIASDLSRLELHVQVDEADVGRVREGLAAEFHVDAYPDKTFASRVESLHNDATTSDNVVTYEAVLSVDNGQRLLRPGMTATATIVSESRTQVLLVPNAGLRFTPPAEEKGGGPMPPPPGAKPAPLVVPPGAEAKKHVFVLREGKPAPVFFSAGATDGKSTEVLGDELAPGMLVVTDLLEETP